MGSKRVLVMGAGSYSKKDASIRGIGTCLVERLAREDNFIILFTYYKSQEGASRLVKKVKSEHHNIEVDYLRFNSLSFESEWKNLESTLRSFGTPHVFVYNAGLRFYKQSLTASEKEETMRVNYSCPVFLIERIGEEMYNKGIRGKIVLTSSVLAGKYHPFLEDYCLSKGLLEKYVREHSEYWKERGIEIYIVSPNVTKTPMTEEQIADYEEEVNQNKRPGIASPEEIAGEIASLCLDNF
ncbi:SDR family oxidoreductase [Candidatus Woesearchaeota archaeon]|nr:SDR family oxidoreductase [Candidatus Woesearchaeota archaeon]